MKTKAIRGKVKSYVMDEGDIKSLASESYDLAGYANKTNKDRYAEIVDATAFASSVATYNKNPVMLYMHDPTQLIGNFPVVEIRHDGLFVQGRIGHGFEPADTARKQVEQGILKAMSIGFIPKKTELDPEDQTYHIRDLELLEISLVSIPANQEALFQMDETGKHTKTILLNDEQAVKTNEELTVELGIEVITNVMATIDNSTVEDTETAAPSDAGSADTPLETPAPTTTTTAMVTFNGAGNTELIEEKYLALQVGQALGMDEMRQANSQLTTELQATKAELAIVERRLVDVEKALVALISGEITALEREFRIARAA